MISPNSPVNNNINSVQPPSVGEVQQPNNDQFSSTMKVASEYLSEVNETQQGSEASIKDLLSGNNEDVTSVVSAVAKADMSFKLLVGVRNKLVEAYKQTMNMQL